MAGKSTSKSNPTTRRWWAPWSHGGSGRTARTRRTELRKNLGQRPSLIRSLLADPAHAYALGIALLFAVLTSLIMLSTRDQIWLSPGRISTETRLARADVVYIDEEATKIERGEAERNTPSHFRADEARLGELRDALLDFPILLSKYEQFDQLEPELISRYNITDASFQAVRAQSQTPQRWQAAVDRLVYGTMLEWPIVSDDDFARAFASEVRLITPATEVRKAESNRVIRLSNVSVERMRRLVTEARLPTGTEDLVAQRIAIDPRPTFTYDDEATKAARRAARDAVEDATRKFSPGDVIYRRGEVVSESQLRHARQEIEDYRAQMDWYDAVSDRLGMIGLVCIVVTGMGIFVASVQPRIVQNPVRALALAGLMLLMHALAVGLSRTDPQAMYLTGLAPPILMAMVLVIVYDQRLALTLTAMFGVILTASLGQGIGFLVVLLAGTAVVVWQLREIRHRNSIMRAGVTGAAALGIATILVGFMERPMEAGILNEIIVDAALASIASVIVSLFILGILPTIERLFDVTTGLKLVELRDTKQPLLRELQQRAPGTFNHSLTVASIAENAAEDHRRRFPADLRRRALPRHRQDEQARLLHREPGRRLQQARQAQPRHVALRHRRAREGRHRDGAGSSACPDRSSTSWSRTTAPRSSSTSSTPPREQAAENPEQDDALPRLEYRYPGPKPRTQAKPPSSCSATASSRPRAPWPTPLLRPHRVARARAGPQASARRPVR
jgi:membrane-associated HD superfamily phosphohydrolase